MGERERAHQRITEHKHTPASIVIASGTTARQKNFEVWTARQGRPVTVARYAPPSRRARPSILDHIDLVSTPPHTEPCWPLPPRRVASRRFAPAVSTRARTRRARRKRWPSSLQR